MNVSLSRFLERGDSLLIALEPDGQMIVEMSTAFYTQHSGHSLSNVKTTRQWLCRGGWMNWIGRSLLTVAVWVLLSTKDEDTRTLKINTPRSHSGCWCNSSKKQDTNKENK